VLDILITAVATTTRKLPEHKVPNYNDANTSSNDYRGRDKYATTARYLLKERNSDLVWTGLNRETNNPTTAKTSFQSVIRYQVPKRNIKPLPARNLYNIEYPKPPVYAHPMYKYQYYTVRKRSHDDSTTKTTVYVTKIL
jgi:hypothetical protein